MGRGWVGTRRLRASGELRTVELKRRGFRRDHVRNINVLVFRLVN